MYLLPAGQAPRSATKWGALGHWRRNNRGSKGLGEIITSPDGTVIQNTDTGTMIDTSTGTIYDASGNPIGGHNVASPIPTTLIPGGTTLTPPAQPGVNPSIDVAYKNLLTTQQPSQSPLDYVSPQAAIAAGLPPQTVYNAWSTALAKFPSQQAALQAGIPAGVVTQLWAQSRSAVPATSTGTLFGVPTNTLLIGAAVLFGLPMLMGHRGRR